MPVHDENVGVAFALVAIAGASTGIGAAVVFFPSIVKLASRRFLAGCLGFSAGVMCYVSFIEIFQKSLQAFKDAVGDDGKAFAFATLTFFGGVAIMLLLNAFVSWLIGDHGHHHSHRHEIPLEETAYTTNDHPSKQNSLSSNTTTHNDVDDPAEQDLEMGSRCCGGDTIRQLDKGKSSGTKVVHHELDCRTSKEKQTEDTSELVMIDECVCEKLEVPYLDPCIDEKDGAQLVPVVDNFRDQPSPTVRETRTAETERFGNKRGGRLDDHDEKKRLAKMGMTTALAVALHNFPEGIATFVAALNDPKVGAVLAIAIAVHNIPEGLCIAPPIFYATGNRMKAFLWALLSGAAEFVAAFLAWLVLSSSFTDTMYATLFGLVTGMMVIISIRELLPTAHSYDPDDSVVTYSFIGGMMFMALSLVLFVIC